MAISNLGDLKAVVLDELHRRDMADRITEFVDFAHREIARWVAAPLLALVDDTDSNAVLIAYPDAYRFGALARGSAFVRDFEGAAAFQVQFQAALLQIAQDPLALPDGLRVSPSTATVI